MDRSESPSEFWDRRYREAERLWPREPNALLADFAAGLRAGHALDIGAGEGRNALWLAKSGWRVTALDVSEVGLDRAATRAAEEGVELQCVVGDWREYVPASPVDLAVISFMHPGPDERATMFERARAALAPGGYLFTVGVDLVDHGRRGPPDAERLYTPERLRPALSGFEVLRCESIAYEGEGREGPKRVVDVVAIARRPAAE